MRGTTGSAAAPAARCRNCRRGSFIFEPPFTSFDDLVGTREHARWHFDAERLGSLEVDHQLVVGWLLDRKIARLLTLEDAVDVAGRVPVYVDRIGPVGDQAAAVDKVSERVDRGQPVPGCQRDDKIAMNRGRRGTRSESAWIRGARRGQHGR